VRRKIRHKEKRALFTKWKKVLFLDFFQSNKKTRHAAGFQPVKKPLGCVEGPLPFDCNPQPATCAAARSGSIPLPISIYDRKNRLSSPVKRAGKPFLQ